MSTLLAFHKSILEKIHDPLTSELLLLARGLGLRRIVCKFLHIYESPQNLVLLVNASPEEESAIGEELGIMGCRKPGLRIVGYETGKKDRCAYHPFYPIGQGSSLNLISSLFSPPFLFGSCLPYPTLLHFPAGRQDLYKKGGLISVTSQILTVDMLTSEMPTHLITGIIVLHAERSLPLIYFIFLHVVFSFVFFLPASLVVEFGLSCPTESLTSLLAG